MNLEPAPRLPKWTFLLIDLGLLLMAFLIVTFARNPYAPLPFVSAVLCVGLAAIIGLVPFLVDYAANSAEYVQQERARVNDQVQRLHTAGESLARAAAQIKAVEEAIHKTAHAAENLPYRMQEKLAEFNEALAEKEESGREALEQELAELRAANSGQLKAVADKIHQAAADWSALEAATRKQLTGAQAALVKVQDAVGDTAAQFEARLNAALAALDTKLAAFAPPVAAVTHRGTEATPTDDGGHPPPLQDDPLPSPAIESVGLGAPASVVEEPPLKKPRTPRKPRTGNTAPATAGGTSSGESAFPDSPVEPAPAATSDEPAASAAPAESARPEPVEAAASSDGATRLLVTAYIGIGNKLFIRGDGPGLSWDKGVPMQFVSIGKWGWATHDATGTVACKLYKNDETAALSGGIFLEPGQHVEVTALF